MIELKRAAWDRRFADTEGSEQFALTEVSYVLVRMAQHYEKIEALDPSKIVPKTVRLNLVPLHGVKVRLFRSVR